MEITVKKVYEIANKPTIQSRAASTAQQLIGVPVPITTQQ